MKYPLVSIIIPSHNRSKLIHERALQSAIEQTYGNKQIIVVDDGSTEAYDIRLPAWYYKPWDKNKGGSAARNFGLEVAHGDYIVFIDDDNMLHPKFLEILVPWLEKNMNQDAVTTYRNIMTPEALFKAETTVTKFPAIDWGWLIRRHVFQKIEYDTSIWGDEDADLGIQFRQAGFTYAVYPDYLQTAYAPAESEEESSNTYPNERRLRGLYNFLSKNLHEYKDPDERRYILRLAGRNYLRAGHYWIGTKYFFDSWVAKKNWPTFKHFLFACFGWNAYNAYMSREERRSHDN